MDQKSSDDQYSPEETARRRDEAIRRALNTPPKPNNEYAGKRERAQKAHRFFINLHRPFAHAPSRQHSRLDGQG